MRLHILAGCRELLQPEILAPEVAAGLIGPQVRLATAFWLSPKCGKGYHNFLQDAPGDGRTKVMASSLRDDFGDRLEPLLVLPDLLQEVESGSSGSSRNSAPARSQLTVLSEIWNYGGLEQARLYGVALATGTDAKDSGAASDGLATDKVRKRMDALLTTLIAETGAGDVDTEVIEVAPDHTVFGSLYHNAICHQIALRLASRFRNESWKVDVDTLAAAVSRTLNNWQDKGLAPSLPMPRQQLDAMSDVIYAKWF